MCRIEQRSEPGYIRQVLPDQLVGQAAVAHLELGLGGIVRAHITHRNGVDLVLGNPAHLLDIVFAVEKAGVDKLAPTLEQIAVIAGSRIIAQRPRHLLGGSQAAQVINPAQRIGTVELDIIRVVLHALHDAVAIRIPAAGNPREGQGQFDPRPQGAQPGSVAA